VRKVELSLQERRRGRKTPSLMGKSDANDQNEYNEQRGTTKDWLFPFVRLEAIVSGVSAIITKVATKRKMEKAPRKSISIPSKAQK